MVRLWNVSIRSAGQQPSRAEYGKWKVDIAELFAKVTLWRDRPESFFRQEIWASYIRFVATLLIRLRIEKSAASFNKVTLSER
jgi:hypothetical protein